MPDAKTSADTLATIRAKGESISRQLANIPTPATQASIQAIQSSLVELNALFNESVSLMYPYDQRLGQQQLKTLEDELNVKRQTIPKSRFAFSKKAPVKKDPPPAPAPIPVSQSPVEVGPPGSDANIKPHTDGLEITNTSRTYINLTSLLSNIKLKEDEQHDVSLSNLKHCLVDLRPVADTVSQNVSLKALYVRGLNRTVVITSFVHGSIRIQDCQECIFVVACRQFRVEKGEKNTFFLHVVSVPVIENAKELGFAAYPMEDLVKDQPPSQHENVKDFSWIRTDKPSPNWYMLNIGDPSRLQSLREPINYISKSIGTLCTEDQAKLLEESIDGALTTVLKTMKPADPSAS